MMRNPVRLVPALVLAACGQTALADWQCLAGGATVPAAAQAASEYLGRAERVFPDQLLGVLRSGDRVYLVNARDDGWSERVRLGLMELRLAEPDITAARRFQAARSGGSAPEAGQIPAGEFVCLARERAARQGLAFSGEAVLLAVGRSVHLVDPVELAIAVEVRAVGGQPLDLREIFAASTRAGIYAGLFRGRAQPGPVVAARPPDSAVTFPVGPLERPDGEVVITPRAGMMVASVAAAGAADALPVQVPAAVPVARATPAQAPAPVLAAPAPPEQAPAVVLAAPSPPAQAPAAVPTVPARPIVVETPARVARADVPVAPAIVKPLAPAASPAVVTEIAAPVFMAARVSAPVVQAPRGVGGQSYGEYAKAMKELMELRRSGGVRSISEMTYVHPAVEDLRARR